MGSALVCVELGVGPMFEPNKFEWVKSTPHLITRDRDPRRTDQLLGHTGGPLHIFVVVLWLPPYPKPI